MLKNYLKHSGIWIGLVINPYHWSFGVKKYDPGCIHFGPLWIRVYVGNSEDY
jgi:hypothetical protein